MASEQLRRDKMGNEQKGASNVEEEISKYRGRAQQNSMDKILAAEDKYYKSREKGGADVGEKRSFTEAAMEKAKESLSSYRVLENAAKVSDFTVVKGQQLNAGLSSAAEKAKDVSKKSVSAALETGKSTAGYVGKVGGVVKDKAVVAGWSAAEFASEKAVGVTETMANVTASVAGYAGDTVVAAKDVLVDVGKKTKDIVVSTEESAKDYAARKKEEKLRELEVKNSSKATP